MEPDTVNTDTAVLPADREKISVTTLIDRELQNAQMNVQKSQAQLLQLEKMLEQTKTAAIAATAQFELLQKLKSVIN